MPKAYIIGEYDWKTGARPAATMTVDTTTRSGHSKNSVKIAITSVASQDYHIQLLQPGVLLTSGITYTLSFYAQASMPRSFRAMIQSSRSPNYAVYAQNVFTIATAYTWRFYSMSVTMNIGDSIAFVAFNVGTGTQLASSTIWFDDIRLVPGGGANILQNSGFTASTTSIAPWVSHITGASDDLSVLLPAIENNTAVSGAIAWNLWPHDTTHGYLIDNDVDSIYYPVGRISAQNPDTDQAARFQKIRTHGFQMQAISPAPPALQPVPVPTLLTVRSAAGTNTIAWHGVVGAKAYTLQYAPCAAGPWCDLGTSYNDFDTPISHVADPSTFYQVAAENTDGVFSAYSAPVSGL
ncbi:MAG: hypothetical protein PVS3B1_16120 [Ktedonobacteraceae bacterium]